MQRSRRRPDAEPADDRQDDVLGVDAAAQPPVDVDAPHLQRIERQALRRQHVAHLRRADAERDRAERAVRGRVAVAARDRHARLRQPELGADHVDDALVRRRPASTAAMPKSRQLRSSDVVISSAITSRNGRCCALRRHDVIDRREGALRKRDASSPAAAACRTPAALVTS